MWFVNFEQNVEDYENIIKAATSTSVKARQLAAQLIPRFFKFFPDLSVSAVDAHLDLCEAEELGVSNYFLWLFFYDLSLPNVLGVCMLITFQFDVFSIVYKCCIDSFLYFTTENDRKRCMSGIWRGRDMEKK